MDLLPIALLAIAILVAGEFAWHRSRIGQEQAARQQIERALAARQAELDRLQLWLTGWSQASLDALLLVDANRRIQAASDSAELVLGERDIVGRSVIEATHSAELDDLVQSALIGHGDLDRQLLVKRQAMRARAVTLADGRFVALTVHDVSELQRLSRARRDFVANLSHELRTPLSSLRLLAETLSFGGLEDPTRAADLVAKINLEVESIQNLAQEMMDLAEIESGRAPMHLRPSPVRQLIQGPVERLAPLANSKHQTIAVQLPGEKTGGDALQVLADAEHIRRVLVNLLNNAIKFGPNGGQIEVSVAADGAWAIVSVADTGPGIHPDELERIFERFYQSDRSRHSGGTGLGLAIARHIVQAHGGRIWAENAPEHGAILRFTLPLAEPIQEIHEPV